MCVLCLILSRISHCKNQSAHDAFPWHLLLSFRFLSIAMYVVKRDGHKEPVHFDKVTSRISKLCYGLNEEFVEPILVSQKVRIPQYLSHFQHAYLVLPLLCLKITYHPDMSYIVLHKDTLIFSHCFPVLFVLYHLLPPLLPLTLLARALFRPHQMSPQSTTI